jgi:hypothetical protein
VEEARVSNWIGGERAKDSSQFLGVGKDLVVADRGKEERNDNSGFVTMDVGSKRELHFRAIAHNCLTKDFGVGKIPFFSDCSESRLYDDGLQLKW